LEPLNPSKYVEDELITGWNYGPRISRDDHATDKAILGGDRPDEGQAQSSARF